MLGEAIQYLRSLPRDAAQRADAFEHLAKQIENRTGGAWSAERGAGRDDEPTFKAFADNDRDVMPEGALRENIVVGVEAYDGKVGGQGGVKREEELWITADGPRVISRYPYD